MVHGYCYFTLSIFIDASRIGLVVVELVTSCIFKNITIVFFLFLDCFSFVLCHHVHVKSILDEIGTRFSFCIGPLVDLFDYCAPSML